MEQSIRTHRTISITAFMLFAVALAQGNSGDMSGGSMAGNISMSGGMPMSGSALMGQAMESVVKVMVFQIDADGNVTAVSPATMGWPDPVATITVSDLPVGK